MQLRLDSNIELKSLNNTYLNIMEIFNKLFKKLNIIESRNLIITSTYYKSLMGLIEGKEGHLKDCSAQLRYSYFNFIALLASHRHLGGRVSRANYYYRLLAFSIVIDIIV